MASEYHKALAYDCVVVFRDHFRADANASTAASVLATCMYMGAARCMAHVLNLFPGLANQQVNGVTPLECLLPFHHIRDGRRICHVLRVLLDAGADPAVLSRPGRGFDWWHPWYIHAPPGASADIYAAAYLLIDHGLIPGAADPPNVRDYYAATLRAKARQKRAMTAFCACLQGAHLPRDVRAIVIANCHWKEWASTQ